MKRIGFVILIFIAILLIITTLLIVSNQYMRKLEINTEGSYLTLTTHDDFIILHTGVKINEINRYKDSINSRKISPQKVEYSLEVINNVRQTVFAYEEPLVLQSENIFYPIKSLNWKPYKFSKSIIAISCLGDEMKWIND